jgi:hypothetical protein
VARFEGIPDTVRIWLHLEGGAFFIAGVIAYARLGGDLIWLIPLLLLPDLSMIGYVRGPALGAFTYDLVHNWAVGLAVLGLGLLWSSTPLELTGVVLIAHVGMDRLAGYGLKHTTGFKDTHMQRA